MKKPLKECVVFATLSLFLPSVAIRAADSPDASTKPAESKSRSRPIDIFAAAAALGLNEEGKQKLKALEAEFNRTSKLAMEDQTTSREDKKAAMQEIRKKAVTDVRAILSDDQKMRFDRALSNPDSEKRS